VAAADIEGHADPVAGLETLDCGADFHHHAKVFVAKDAALLEIGPALVHVQVGPADVGAGDLDEGVGGAFDLRVWHVFDGDLVGTSIHNSFHGQLLELLETNVPFPGYRRTRQSVSAVVGKTRGQPRDRLPAAQASTTAGEGTG